MCRGQKARLTPVRNRKDQVTGYVLHYPDEADPNFAAIVHELAHAFQVETAGGWDKFFAGGRESLSMELGADYLTGAVFQNLKPQPNANLFAHYLAAYAIYFETADAHGEPAQRNAAFRLGLKSRDYETLGSYSRMEARFEDDVLPGLKVWAK